MKRLTGVRLEEEQFEFLQELADILGISMAEVLRRTIDNLFMEVKNEYDN